MPRRGTRQQLLRDLTAHELHLRNDLLDEDVHPSEVWASLAEYSTEELRQLAAFENITPKRPGRSFREPLRQTLSDAFVVFPIEELARARKLSKHAACRIIALRLHRRVSWEGHWKRYQRARRRNRFTQTTLQQFLLDLQRDLESDE
jgi:hypothetical protein